jgi:hypothetical protein
VKVPRILARRRPQASDLLRQYGLLGFGDPEYRSETGPKEVRKGRIKEDADPLEKGKLDYQEQAYLYLYHTIYLSFYLTYLLT